MQGAFSINSACGQRVSASILCRWGVVGGVGFRLSCCRCGWGACCLAGPRGSPHAARTSTIDQEGLLVHRRNAVRGVGAQARMVQGGVYEFGARSGLGADGCAWGASCLAGSRGSPHAARTSTIDQEGLLVHRRNAVRGTRCRRSGAARAKAESTNSVRVQGSGRMDVLGGLVVSLGLEARRTRLAPRPSIRRVCSFIGETRYAVSALRRGSCKGGVYEFGARSGLRADGCGWEAGCLAGSRGSPHAARTSTIGGKVRRLGGVHLDPLGPQGRW